jgi:hypothetical protein
MVRADWGAWDVTIGKEGYVSWSDSVSFLKAEYPVRLDAHLSAPMPPGDVRFVLSWEAKPADLDAHLVGPTPDGSTFHISYRTMTEWRRRHFLDRDDMNGYGPETITLHTLDPGVYYFAVHNYSDKSKTASSELSASGAKVRVYQASTLVATFEVKEGSPGTLWRVCAMDGRTGAVTPSSEYLYQTQSENVR